MKLIIDIPEEAKKNIDTFKGKFICEGEYDLVNAVQNGIPLDRDSERAEVQAYFHGEAYGWEEGRKALIDNVKAEIQTEYDKLPEENTDIEGGWIEALEWVLVILDNIGKGDSDEGST